VGAALPRGSGPLAANTCRSGASHREQDETSDPEKAKPSKPKVGAIRGAKRRSYGQDQDLVPLPPVGAIRGAKRRSYGQDQDLVPLPPVGAAALPQNIIGGS